MPNEHVTFVVFTSDIVTFALKKILQVDYKYSYQNRSHRKTFHETIGEAVLVFRNRHIDEFAKMIGDYPTPVTDDAKSAIDYLLSFVAKNFKGRVPLMELLTYCACLVDLSVCCTENDRTDLVEDIISESYDVYADHIRSYFDIVGGWLPLLHIARQYLGFVESMRKYSALVDSEKDCPSQIIEASTSTIKFPAIPNKNIHEIATKDEKSNTDSEQGAASAVDSDRIIGLETTDSQVLAMINSFDADYIKKIVIQTSSIDSQDDSSAETDDVKNRRMVNSSIASSEDMDIDKSGTSSLFSQDRQEIFSGADSSYSEGFRTPITFKALIMAVKIDKTLVQNIDARRKDRTFIDNMTMVLSGSGMFHKF